MSPALRISPLIAAVFTLGPATTARAQASSEPAATAVAEPANPPVTVESSDSAAPAKPQPAAPSSVATALADMRPKYNPPAKPGEEPADLREIDKPKNSIIRLPKYEVKVSREPKPMVFTESELLTAKGMAEIAMKRNPGLRFGNIFGWNTGIAVLMYQEQLRLDNMAAMADLSTNARNSGDPAGADRISLEALRAYYRPSPIGGGRISGPGGR